MTLVFLTILFGAVSGALMMLSDRSNSTPYAGPWAERFTGLDGTLRVLVIPMYNYQPRDTRIIPMYNFAKSVYATNPEYRPLHNFGRGAN